MSEIPEKILASQSMGTTSLDVSHNDNMSRNMISCKLDDTNYLVWSHCMTLYITGIKVRVYCQVGKRNHGNFALDVAVKSLDLFRLYFKTPYALPKLDMISIPDFQAGAMENYGLVTYRETDLLYDDQHSSAANKQQVCITVAHELAHQWFGNLVTMEWWTHIWLNEGFATWLIACFLNGISGLNLLTIVMKVLGWMDLQHHTQLRLRLNILVKLLRSLMQ